MKRVTISLSCVRSDAFYFNPHPLWRGWPNFFSSKIRCFNFNPHPLWRGWLKDSISYCVNHFISIHTLCEEGDDEFVHYCWVDSLFQSTPSVKRVTVCHFAWWFQQTYFNPHPLWRGWHFCKFWYIVSVVISIHTLCEEGDIRACQKRLCVLISIHTLCEEGDRLYPNISKPCSDFNPHPLWRGWRSWVDCHMFRIAISIHTLCEEGDSWLFWVMFRH